MLNHMNFNAPLFYMRETEKCQVIGKMSSEIRIIEFLATVRFLRFERNCSCCIIDASSLNFSSLYISMTIVEISIVQL